MAFSQLWGRYVSYGSNIMHAQSLIMSYKIFAVVVLINFTLACTYKFYFSLH